MLKYIIWLIWPEKKAQHRIECIINTLEINIASSKLMNRSMIIDLVKDLAKLRPEERYISIIASCIMFNADKYGYKADGPILKLLYKAIEIEEAVLK